LITIEINPIFSPQISGSPVGFSLNIPAKNLVPLNWQQVNSTEMKRPAKDSRHPLWVLAK